MIILFDIGGTKMRFAGKIDDTTFSEPVILDTPASFEEGIDLITKTAKAIAGEESIDFMCGGLAGVANESKTGVVAHSSHTPEWEEKDFVGRLSERLDTHVLFENDADMVGLGEALFGAGEGQSIVGYITVSTGVGGGRIVDGQIDANTIGFEPGHQLMDEVTTLEQMVSGTAIEKRFNKKPYEIPQSDQLWSELANTLALGLHNTMVHWSVDVLVLGGSMIVGDPAILMEDMEQALLAHTTVDRELPALKKAELGALGGLYGALAYSQGLVE